MSNQDTIIVGITVNDEGEIKEHGHEALHKSLSNGCEITNVHQMSSAGGGSSAALGFFCLVVVKKKGK